MERSNKDRKRPFLTVTYLTKATSKMKQIKLNQDKFALIDDEDYQLMSQYRWCIVKCKNNLYARITVKPNTRMHRLIINCPSGLEIDHINGDGLDNQKGNLRVCTHAQNLQNKRSQKGTSKYKGVHWDKASKNWRAQIGFKGAKFNLGLFNSEIGAAKTYDKKAKELFGSFALINF